MILNDEQKITYLANAIAIARANSSISPNESRVIEDIQKQIAAKKTILKKAENKAEDSDYIPTPIGSLSVKIANLEDMILISLIDGDMDQSEKSLVLDFARKIGVSSNQLKQIHTEAKSLVSSSSDQRTCSNCSALVKSSAKFCPECGKSLHQNDKEAGVVIAYGIPQDGIVIEFAESTLSSFVDALRIAKEAPTQAECMKGKKAWYMAAWPKSEMADAVKLVDNLKGMRNRKVWLDGKESRWDDIFGFSWCSAERNSAYRPVEYCFGIDQKKLNIWGCKNARMDWIRWANWFSYGKFKKSGILKNTYLFIFDKQKIRHELETNLHKVRFCPYLNHKLVEEVLDLIPDEVEVKANGEWGYKQDYDESPGCVKVKEKIVEDGYTYTNNFYASGVIPRSPNLGLQILKKAYIACNADSAEIKGILKYQGEE